MHKASALALMALLALPGVVAAQSSGLTEPGMTLLPGSISVSAGTISPTERDNVLANITVEQGATAWHRGGLFLVGFVTVTQRHDSQARSWNRTTPMTAGVKFVASTRGGVIQAVAGITAQTIDGRWSRGDKAFYATYWNGWTGSTPSMHVAGVPNAFPGHAWASSGYVSAAEPENWVSSVSIRQGVTVARAWGVAVTPFVAASASADTSGFAWNNRTQWDTGVNISRPMGVGVIEVGAAKRREWNRLTNQSDTAPMVYVNFWLGWNPGIAKR
jgi:hypothetical protein